MLADRCFPALDMSNLRRSSRLSSTNTSYKDGSESDEEEERSASDDDHKVQQEAAQDDEEDDEEEKTAARRQPSQRRQTGNRLPRQESARPAKRARNASAGSAGSTSRLSEQQDRSEDSAANDQQSVSNDDDSVLYAALRGSEVPSAVKEWLVRYQQSHKAGIMELINLILQVVECEGVLEELPETEEDITEVVDDLTDPENEQFGDASNDYLLGKEGKAAKKMKQNFTELWHKIVVLAPSSVICDGVLLPVMTEWIIRFQSCKVFPLRHTGTAVGMELLRACIDVANDTKKNDTTTKRQLDGENKKKKKNQQKISELEDRTKALEEMLDVLEDTMKGLFDGVFVHRYRDQRPAIRTLSIRQLGTWVAEYPSVFLVDNYLKYLGWQLYDKAADVRLAATEAVAKLYSNPAWIANLALFTTRFKKRMLALTLDTSSDVAETAIDMVSELFKNEMLDDDEIEDVCRLVRDEDPKIRKQAGTFIKLVALYASDDPQEPGGTDPEFLGNQIRVLLAMCPSEDVSDLTPLYIADTLFEEMPVLESWEVMTSMLLEEGDDALDEVQQPQLATLMVACVRKIHGRDVFTGQSVQKLSKKWKDQLPDKQAKMTSHFIPIFGNLLRRFQADEHVMKELAKIPVLMDVEQYAVQRKKKSLTEMLNLLRSAYSKHSDENLLSSIAESFQRLTETDFSFTKECSGCLDKLRDSLAAELNRGLSEVMSGDAEDQEAVDYVLTVMLSRIQHLLEKVDIRSADIFESLKQCLVTGPDDEEELGANIVLNALRALHAYCVWECNSCLNILKESGEEAAGSKIKETLSSRDDVFERFFALRTASSAQIRSTTFAVLADLSFWYKQIDSKLARSSHSVPEAKLLEWFEQALDSQDGDQVNYASSLCGAVVCGALPYKDVAPKILTHYIKHGKQVEKVIKLMMTELKRSLRGGHWQVQSEALKLVFNRYVETNDEQVYSELQDLASKIASEYPRILKNKAAPMQLVKGGVEFSVEDVPRNLPFMEAVLVPITATFGQNEKKSIHQQLTSHLDETNVVPDEDDQDWSPYYELETHLLGSKKTRSKSAGPSAATESGERKSVGSRRTLEPDLDQDIDDDDDDELEPQSSSLLADKSNSSTKDAENSSPNEAGSANHSISGRSSSESATSKRKIADAPSQEEASQDDADNEDGDFGGFKPKLRSVKADAKKRNSAGFARKKRRR
eukprot:SAG31_NODE_458_length_15415_cov_3.647428_6_plen_1202_part_00